MSKLKSLNLLQPHFIYVVLSGCLSFILWFFVLTTEHTDFVIFKINYVGEQAKILNLPRWIQVKIQAPRVSLDDLRDQKKIVTLEIKPGERKIKILKSDFGLERNVKVLSYFPSEVTIPLKSSEEM